MPLDRDPGFSNPVLFFFFFLLILPLFAFFIRRKWRISAARKEEIRRLVVLASEEAARVELEAAFEYSGTVISNRQHCAVCYCPTTTRCAQCKSVRYCSGKCQIIHWRQGHKEECRPASTTVQFNGAGSDSDFNSGSQAEESDLKDNSLEHKGGSHAKPIEEYPESPKSSKSNGSSNILSGKDDLKVKPLMDTIETVISSISPSTTGPTYTKCAEPLVNISVSEHSASSKNAKSEPSVSTGAACDILEAKSNAYGTKPAKSSTSEFTSPISPVNRISFSSKLNQKEPGCGTERAECGSSSSSCSSLNSSDEFKVTEPSTAPDGRMDATRDSSGAQGSGHIDSNQSSLRQGENSTHSDSVISSQAVPPVISRRSNSKTIISDNARRSSSRNGNPAQGAGSSKNLIADMPSKLVTDMPAKLVADVPTLKNLPTLGSERSSSLFNKRSCDEQQSKARGERSFSSITSSKVDSIYTVPTCSSETVSSVSNGSNGLKTSMRKVVQQFRVSKISKHHESESGNEIAGKYNYKMLFPYDLFIKLYHDKVELRPCGLTNCGNSCYANAVLQCLAFTRPLAAYLLQGLHTKTCPKKEWCFTCEFESLVLKSKEGKSPLSPIGILSQIQSIGCNLGHGREEDAHEFLRYAIDKMQSVCLKEGGVNAVGPLAEETTLIQLIFGGYLRSKIKCMKCLGKSERRERMMDLTVEIDGDIGTLEEALAQFTATEILDGDNKYQCGRCKSYEKAKKKLTVLEAPNVLTIALKRFQSGKFGKLNKSVRFPEILNLHPYMSCTSDKSPVYSLYAVVVHLDIMNAAFSGHYVCYVKNFQGKWYKTNDSKVKPVELDRVLSKGAYMLLYARCSPRAPSLIRNAMSKRTKCTEAIPSSRSERSIPKEKSTSSVSHSTPSATPRRTEDYPYFTTLDSPAITESYDPLDGRFHRIHRIPKVESYSDNSSLFSCSDEGSCSTESTRDSTSTDEYTGYIFGDSGRFSWNSRVTDDYSDVSSCSTFSSRPSPLSISNGHVSNSPEHGYSTWDFSENGINYERGVEADGFRPQQSRGEVLQGKESPALLYSDTLKQRRKLTDLGSSSSRNSETDWEFLGWVNPCDVKSGVSLRSSRDRTTQTFY
ncbi:ubiquitin-specific protease 16 [Tasmannia lanceolata]|uniref:ubiquitin-specific protease 16 n=1 Tax=Tasmannia lanceolata TaxID=3420 RepID=UPI00406403C9